MNSITVSGVQLLTFVFVLGAIVGSFLNVMVYRLGTGDSIVAGRSRCFSCGRTLGFFDLVPIFSFLFQKGRCRYCGSRISWQYLIVEFATGLIFVLVWWNIFQSFSTRGGSALGGQSTALVFKLLYFFVVFSLLIAISVYDFRHKIIPNQLVYPFILLTFVFGNLDLGILNLFGIWDFGFGISAPAGMFFGRIIAGFIAFAFFGSLWFVSQGRWMGFGDAKLALGMGFLLGPVSTVLAGMLSFWIGTLVAVPATLLGGGGLKTQIPFGPFLAAGCFVAWLWGEELLSFYFSILS